MKFITAYLKKIFVLQAMLLLFCFSMQSKKNCVDLSQGGIVNFLRGFQQAFENRYLELKNNLDKIYTKKIINGVSDELSESVDSVSDALEESTASIVDDLDQSNSAIIVEIQDIQQDLQLDIDALQGTIIIRNANKTGTLFDVFDGCPALGNQNVITKPGYYALRKNIDARVRIEASDVVINLNDFTLTADPDSDCGTVPAIQIAPGNENIKIINGKIEGFSNLSIDGIEVGSSCSGIKIENVKIFSCQNGINLNGSLGNEISGCAITSCELKTCNSGVSCIYADSCVLENVKALSCKEAGFWLENSQFMVLKKCEALYTANNEAGKRALGFASFDGTANLFAECVADGTTVTNSDFCRSAIGFLLEGQEESSEIVSCIVNLTDASDVADANAFGILLNPIEIFTSPLVPAYQYNHGTDIRSVKWSPSCEFLAIAGDGAPNVRILDQTLLPLLLGVFTNPSPVHSVDWTEDGSFIVIGHDTGATVLLFAGLLTPIITSAVLPVVRSVSWNPISYQDASNPAVFQRFFAAGSSGVVSIFEFISSPPALNSFASVPFGVVYSVDWSSNGKFLAIASSSLVWVYQFDPFTPTFSSVANYSYGAGTSALSVSWSPNGKYLAVGGDSNAANTRVVLLEFSGSSLTEVDSFIQNAAKVNSVSWSPNGKSLAIASQASASTDELKILNFDGTSLAEAASYSPGNVNMYSVNWSPCGRFLAYGADSAIANNVRSFGVMKEPTNCMIKRNNISNTKGIGIGLSGLGSNVFLNNICFNNDIDVFNVPNTYFYDPNTVALRRPAFYDNIDVID